MADFFQKVECRYGTDSYQAVKNTYDWITKSAQKLKLKNLQINEKFIFKVGEILCEAQSIVEFSNYAYGSESFELIQFHISIYDGNKNFVSVMHLVDCYVHASNKATLEKFVALLKSTSLDETEMNDPISVTYIGQQNNEIAVNGNGNIIATHQSTVVSSEKNDSKESKAKQWINAISQNLVSNGVWYLLTLIVGAIIGLLAAK